MPKKSNNTKRKTIRKSEIARKSAVRRSPVPRASKKVMVAPSHSVAKVITFEMIAERAYHISQSVNGGSQDENWHRAERELRGGL